MGYYLELLAPETIKLIESIKSKITKNKNKKIKKCSFRNY